MNDEGLADAEAANPFRLDDHVRADNVGSRQGRYGVRTRLQNVELGAALERAAFLRDLHRAA